MRAKRCRLSFGGNENFKMDCSDRCTTLNTLKVIELYTLNE